MAYRNRAKRRHNNPGQTERYTIAIPLLTNRNVQIKRTMDRSAELVPGVKKYSRTMLANATPPRAACGNWRATGMSIRRVAPRIQRRKPRKACMALAVGFPTVEMTMSAPHNMSARPASRKSCRRRSRRARTMAGAASWSCSR